MWIWLGLWIGWELCSWEGPQCRLGAQGGKEPATFHGGRKNRGWHKMRLERGAGVWSHRSLCARLRNFKCSRRGKCRNDIGHWIHRVERTEVINGLEKEQGFKSAVEGTALPACSVASVRARGSYSESRGWDQRAPLSDGFCFHCTLCLRPPCYS